MKKNDQVKQLKSFLEEVITLLGVSGSVEGKREEGVIDLSVVTETPALLIGYHGKTVNALQAIVGAVAYKKFGSGIRVIVDVDNWRSKREEQLVNLAKNLAQRVKTTGREEPIYNLTNYERRVVHIALTSEPDITTESVGEGRERYLVIKLAPPAKPLATHGKSE